MSVTSVDSAGGGPDGFQLLMFVFGIAMTCILCCLAGTGGPATSTPSKGESATQIAIDVLHTAGEPFHDKRDSEVWHARVGVDLDDPG